MKNIWIILFILFACGMMQAHAATLQILAATDSVISSIDCSGAYNVRITRPGMAGTNGNGYGLDGCRHVSNDIWECNCAKNGLTNVTFKYNKNAAAQFNALISYDIVEGNRTFNRVSNVLFNTQIYYDKIKAQQDMINLIKVVIVVIIIIIVIVAVIYFLIRWLFKQDKEKEDADGFMRDK
jgi:hypothetical protein